jgi:thioredoxin 1
MTEASLLQDSDYTQSVLYFSAPWCGPCRTLGPLIEDLSHKYPTLTFIKVNVDNASELASKHKVSSIPTVTVFINGEEKDRLVGLNPKTKYESLFAGYSQE